MANFPGTKVDRHGFVRGRLPLLVVCLICSPATLAQVTAKPSDDDCGSIRLMVSQAKRASQTSVILPDAIYEYAGFHSLENAIQNTSLTLAELVASETNCEESRISTWRKYRRVSSLSTVPVYEPTARIEHVPASLLPIAKNEFVVGTAGGTLTLDGVEVTEHTAGLRNLPADHLHLMFLLFRGTGGKVGVSNYGPMGFLWVDDAENIHPVDKPELNPIYQEIVQQAGGDLTKLRALASEVVRSAKSAHPPSR